jgi:hypothetical protein
MLPKPLESDLGLALAAVQAHPDHVLNPGYRWLIWEHLGPRGDQTTPRADIGHRRRALLAMASARRVLALWRTRWPEDTYIPMALAAAADYLDGRRSETDCWRIADRARDAVHEVITEDFAASFAGESAVQALRATLADEYFRPGVRELDWVDGQLDGDDDDAASTAAIAVSGGTALDPGTDAVKRLAFWQWWLQEAVPEAYRDGQQTRAGHGDARP